MMNPTAYLDDCDEELESNNLGSILQASLEQGSLLICVKDQHKKVIRQNTGCKTLCGDREGQACTEGCMAVYEGDESQQWKDWGSRIYRNYCHKGKAFDATLICTERRIITILQPLEEKHTEALDYYLNMNLSKREVEVISCVISGMHNVEICQKLSISNATIRTHLNNIYRKAQEAGVPLKHIPAARAT